jgi:hypothetical protein
MVSSEFIQLCEDMANWESDSVLADTPYDEKLSIDVAWHVVTLTYNRAEEYHVSFLALAHASARAIAYRTKKTITEIAIDMQDLHRRKNAGYSGECGDPWKNFRHSTAFGVTPYIGCLVRMSDKYQRYCNLYGNGALEQVGEPIIDTLMDLACYSLIAVCLHNERNKTGKIAVFGEY